MAAALLLRTCTEGPAAADTAQHSTANAHIPCHLVEAPSSPTLKHTATTATAVAEAVLQLCQGTTKAMRQPTKRMEYARRVKQGTGSAYNRVFSSSTGCTAGRNYSHLYTAQHSTTQHGTPQPHITRRVRRAPDQETGRHLKGFSSSSATTSGREASHNKQAPRGKPHQDLITTMNHL